MERGGDLTKPTQGSLAQGTYHSVVREGGRRDSGELHVKELNVERVPWRGSVAVLGEEAAAGGLEVRLGPYRPASPAWLCP